MKRILTTKVHRRTLFTVKYIPALAKAYAWVMGKLWISRFQELFISTPVCLLYLFIQRLFPFPYEGIFELTLGKKKEQIRFNAKNAQFDALYRPTFWKNGYEPELTALLDVLVEDSDIFFDIGSNWGYYSFLVASKTRFKGKVYAFEPFPSTFQDLVSVVSQSSLKDKINCQGIALSDHNGEANMMFSGLLQSGFAYIPPEQSHATLNPKARVPVRTLDTLDIESPHIIKIDAQFHEAAIFNGATKILQKNKPIIVLENCINFNNVDETMNPLWILEKMGYGFYFPCFVKDKKNIVVPSEADRDNFYSDTLALIQIQIDKRFLYRDTINILACHKDKLKLLTSKFTSGE